MLESLPQKTECSKGAESALKKVPENQTLQIEPRSFSLERLLLLGGQSREAEKTIGETLGFWECHSPSERLYLCDRRLIL